MKKNVLFIAVVMIATFANAQKGKVTSALNYIQSDQLEKAWEAIQKAEEHHKSKDWPKTYYGKARVLQAIYESKNEELKQKFENPLIQAYDNYMKTLKMDDKGRLEKDVDLMMMPLSIDFLNRGVEAFNEENYEKALKSFEFAMELEKMPIFQGAVDTSLIYNAGLAANNAGLYDKALFYYQKAADMGYGGPNLYIYMKNVQIAKEDSIGALETLKEGFSKYSDNQAIMVELINHYLIKGESEKALEYLAIAKEKDPSNPSFYFAEGVMYEQIGEEDKAYEAYKKAIEIDPGFFNAYYNLGVLHFNKGVKLTEEANDVMDEEKYKKMKEKADEQFKNSIPYMEKAHEIDPDEISTMETLKMLYYRMKMLDKHERITEELEEAKAEDTAAESK